MTENKQTLFKTYMNQLRKDVPSFSKFTAKYVGVPLLALATIYGTFHSTETEQLKAKNHTELNIVAYNRKGSSKGIVLGAINDVYGTITGLELGIVNAAYVPWFHDDEKSKKKIDNELTINKGAQVSFVNFATSLDDAVQVGILNISGNHEGFYLQLGFFNTSEDRSTILINFGYKSEDLSDTVTETKTHGGN